MLQFLLMLLIYFNVGSSAVGKSGLGFSHHLFPVSLVPGFLSCASTAVLEGTPDQGRGVDLD